MDGDDETREDDFFLGVDGTTTCVCVVAEIERE